MATIKYFISRRMRSEYLQGIEPNEFYNSTSTAPTMGARHTYAEYKTIWGREPKAIERLTASSYIKVIMEEFRWGDSEPYCFMVEPEKLPLLEGA